jgi:Cys-tRNA(Pro) deacylase
MGKDKTPVTPAIRFLKQNKIDFEVFQYEYEEKGGTAQTAEELYIDEHVVIKSLIFENENKECVIVLQHGDLQVSAKELARIAGCKKFAPASADTAVKWSGYQFGGTSPFGTKKGMKIYAESSMFEVSKIYINGGKRGVIVGINPNDMLDCLNIEKVEMSA